MKATVCELSDDEKIFRDDWNELINHLNENTTELLLLPEMPFCKWIASEKQVNNESKQRSVQEHERWLPKLEQLNAKYIVYSRPILSGDKFFNSAFVFNKDGGHIKIHTKTFFPEEDSFWEESWYDHEEVKDFEVVDLGNLKIGALLCTEMWFPQYARQYAKQGIDILVCPRATGTASENRWKLCVQVLSILSGAYCLSSNKAGEGDNDFQWGGTGWIAEPMTGDLLGETNPSKKFITMEIDINKSRMAKSEYPLYVKD